MKFELKILIVEDNADDRKLLRYNFENHGCKNVIEAQDGQEGLDLAKSQKPDLIISDALMPVMDGFQFLRAIKTDENLRSIPFVFYSATYTGYKEVELAISLGAEAFIVKPKDLNELWEKLNSIIKECNLRKEKTFPAEQIDNDHEYFRSYSNIVATKLEEKVRELENAKAVIEAKEQEWQTTFNSIGDCVTIHDKNFNIILANKSCEKVFGASQNEIRSRKCFELFHGKNEPHEACPKINTEQKGKPFEAERFESRLNRWFSIACFPLLDKNGVVRGVVHYAKDITERKKAEANLREIDKKFRVLFESSRDALMTLGPPSWEFTSCNQATVGMFRVKNDEEFITYGPEDLSPERQPDGRASDEKSKEMIETAMLKGSHFFEWTHKRSDGEEFPATVLLTHTELEGKQFLQATVRDLTEQRKLEAQYLQSQKMEVVGQLAGGIAHDFNNILTAITGYGHIALMKLEKDDPIRLNIEHMLEGVDRAAYLTKDILLFSRKHISNKTPVNLNEVVRQVEKFLKRVMGEDIECKTVLQERPIHVHADSHHLEQVLMNLATNARDAIPKGGAFTIATEKVTLNQGFISAHGYGKPGEYALITISDTGIGMDEETRKRIFEPFFTTKEVGKGTGLGLAVVYGIIKEHDGYINVYSEPGNGTTFRIYLPIIASKPRKETKTHQEEASEGGTETILVAEDDESLRNLSKAVLTELGYTVIEAVDGEDAVRKFMENKDRIHLILSDLIMPKMNGKEACDEIRKIKPDIKIIFMSGYAPDIVRQKVLLEDSAQMIFKPMSPNELLKKVRNVLDEGKHN
ncbi:MAG: response regulator [Candidatus Schekmanbacteria bacterium]|nr:response regulator [Candidatus Schekmanbacteria bacterium]